MPISERLPRLTCYLAATLALCCASPVASAPEPSSPPAADASAEHDEPKQDEPKSEPANPSDNPMSPLPGSSAKIVTPDKKGVSSGATLISGRLHPSRVQAAVRAHFGDFRKCYESKLKSNPTLAGRVVPKFTIGRDGQVSEIVDHDSDLPDPEVVACVLKVFSQIRFQAPERGIVTVVYPITLSPG